MTVGPERPRLAPWEALAVGAGAPSGTVTFLFTDIEGSTRLWQTAPAAMRQALQRHDAILGVAIDAHRGYVFSTGGDGFAVASPAAATRWRQRRKPSRPSRGSPGGRAPRSASGWACIPRAAEHLRAVLGDMAFSECAAAGAAMRLPDAVSYARRQLQLTRQRHSRG